MPPTDERDVWRKAQESVFAKAWDNQDDAVYDNMRIGKIGASNFTQPNGPSIT